MTPCLATTNMPQGSFTNSVTLADLPLCEGRSLALAGSSSGQRANFPHYLFGEFCRRVFFSPGRRNRLNPFRQRLLRRIPHSSFFGSVAHVVLVRPDEQVGEVHARWEIAAVANVAVRLPSGREPIQHARGPVGSPLDHRVSIATTVNACGPRPAFIRLASFNLAQKSLALFVRERRNDTLSCSQSASLSGWWLGLRGVISAARSAFTILNPLSTLSSGEFQWQS